MALHVVPAERLAGAQRGLDVHGVSRREAAERRARERLGDGVRSVTRPFSTASAVRQTPLIETESPVASSRRGRRRLDPQRAPAIRVLGGHDSTELANDPGEHVRTVAGSG